MRLVKSLLWVLIFFALLVAAAYGLLWYQTKTYIDQQIAQAASFAIIRYEQLSVDPRGSVELSSLKIQPIGSASEIPVSSLSFKVDDPLFLFDPQGRASAGDWPRLLSLGIANMRLDLGADYLRPVAQPEAGVDAVNLSTLGCGVVREFSPAVLQQMGANSTLVSFGLVAEPDNQAGRLRLAIDMEMSGLASLNSDIEFSFSSGYLKPATAAAAAPRLIALRSRYQDLGFNRLRDQFCAEQSGVAVQQYRTEHLALFRQQLARLGIDLPPQLAEVYSASLDQGTRIEFALRPVGGLGAELLMRQPTPAELVAKLRPSLSLDSRPVDLAGIDWPQVFAGRSQRTEASPEIASNDAGRAPVEPIDEPSPAYPGLPVKPAPLPEKAYQETGFAQLSRYIDSEIRVYTYYGRVIEGRLQDIDGDSMKILQRVDRGLAIYPIDRDKLQSIEVLR